MIFNTENGKAFDTQKDLTAPERHILQKLFLWEALSKSLQEFREKKTAALENGWNDSGPITGTPALKSIIAELEKKVSNRLKLAN